MALIAAGIAAGGSLVGGALGADAQHNATAAQLRGLREGRNQDQANYLTQLAMQEPWRFAGNAALQRLSGFFGLPGGPAYQSGADIAQGNFQNANAANNRYGAHAVLKMLKNGMSIQDIAASGMLKSRKGVVNQLAKHGVSAADIQSLQSGPLFQNQPGAAMAQGQAPGGTGPLPPGYNIFREEGQRDLLGGFGAGGGAFSGNALKGITQFNQAYADKNLVQPLMQIAGFGQGATNMSQQAGQQYGNNMQNNYMNQADVRGSGIAQQGNIWGNAFNQIGQAAGQGYYDYKHPYQPGYTTGGR